MGFFYSPDFHMAVSCFTGGAIAGVPIGWWVCGFLIRRRDRMGAQEIKPPTVADHIITLTCDRRHGSHRH